MDVGDIPPKPPDPTNPSLSPPSLIPVDHESVTNDNRAHKRSSEALGATSDDKRIRNKTDSSDSIQMSYIHPSLLEDIRVYGENDSGPYIVHVSRIEPDLSAGLSIRPIKIGQLLFQNKVKNIIRDGIRSIGRNRISIEFKSALDANQFVSSSFLTNNKLKASIPSYNISRIGLVRGVPTDWSMLDFCSSLELPDHCGKVLKARRLNRKQKLDDKISWIPSQSVVLTFEGQHLPKWIYSFNTSLSVETYRLPTIQCYNCCRFGHVKTQCRSKPRCFRCAQSHSGDSCNINENVATCLHCSGRHFATSPNCAEHTRQRSIKLIMSEENISYQDASARFPSHHRRPYTDVAQTSIPNSSSLNYNSLSQQSHDFVPTTNRSYKKTVMYTPKPRAPLPSGYDTSAHQEIIRGVPSSTPNGCAIQNSPNYHLSPNDNLLEVMIMLLTNIISKWNDGLPTNVAEKLSQLLKVLPENGDKISPMEYQEHQT